MNFETVEIIDHSAPNASAHLFIPDAILAEDRRAAERDDPPRRRSLRVELQASARVRGASQGGVDGLLCNLSEGGCNIEVRQGAFSPGDLVTFKIDGVEPWPGIVKWVEEGRLGIAFERPFYPAVFDAIISANKAAVQELP